MHGETVKNNLKSSPSLKCFVIAHLHTTFRTHSEGVFTVYTTNKFHKRRCKL